MRWLVVSDLHSNDEAVGAVFKKVQRKRIERIVCMGDFVGYGGQPNQVLDRMRKFRATKHYVRGNHDRVAAGFDEGEGFNHAARRAALWTRERLSGPNRRFLQTLRVGPQPVAEGVLICHGSPFDEDEYLFGDFHAVEIFEQYDSFVTFFGHTHLPVVFDLAPTGSVSVGYVRNGGTVKLDRSHRYLINPGSVGQPRDRNPLASFLLYDDKRLTVQFIRVPYDIDRAQIAILRAGLPRILADRLALGT